MLCALCVGQASALEYTMEAPDDYLFGRPTSDDTIYEWDDSNVDRSIPTYTKKSLLLCGIMQGGS